MFFSLSTRFPWVATVMNVLWYWDTMYRAVGTVAIHLVVHSTVHFWMKGDLCVRKLNVSVVHDRSFGRIGIYQASGIRKVWKSMDNFGKIWKIDISSRPIKPSSDMNPNKNIWCYLKRRMVKSLSNIGVWKIPGSFWSVTLAKLVVWVIDSTSREVEVVTIASEGNTSCPCAHHWFSQRVDSA